MYQKRQSEQHRRRPQRQKSDLRRQQHNPKNRPRSRLSQNKPAFNKSSQNRTKLTQSVDTVDSAPSTPEDDTADRKNNVFNRKKFTAGYLQQQYEAARAGVTDVDSLVRPPKAKAPKNANSADTEQPRVGIGFDNGQNSVTPVQTERFSDKERQRYRYRNPRYETHKKDKTGADQTSKERVMWEQQRLQIEAKRQAEAKAHEDRMEQLRKRAQQRVRQHMKRSQSQIEKQRELERSRLQAKKQARDKLREERHKLRSDRQTLQDRRRGSKVHHDFAHSVFIPSVLFSFRV
jgi:hypothetical protein